MSYKTDKWFTSPWNFASEVRSELNFAKQIELHDVTLRDGEQQLGVTFSRDDKVRIAEKLAEIGIHRIEAGMPVASKEDELAIKDIVKRNLGPKIFSYGRCKKDDIDRAVDCGVDGVVVAIPFSPHVIEHCYKWPVEKAIDLTIEGTLYAKEKGLYTVLFPVDDTRADMNWFLDTIQLIEKKGHMDSLVVVDTVGGCSPNAVIYAIKKIKERINKPIEIHFHEDFSLGVANTILALAVGASIAHTTVTSLGERCGNAAYEDIVMSLLTMYGINLGIKTEKLCEVSKFVNNIAGVTVRANRGIVGDNLYKIETGALALWLDKCGDDHLLELCAFLGELVGHPYPKHEVVLGKNSSTDSIKRWLSDLNKNVPDELVPDILHRVKIRAHEKKDLLDTFDFVNILAEVEVNV